MALFKVQTFVPNLSIGNVGRVADALTQFFALNPALTVLDVYFSFRRHNQRAQRLAHLVFNTTPIGQTAASFPGGTRYYAIEWSDNPSGRRAYQKAISFFQENPQFTPVLIKFLPPESQDQSYLFRKGVIAIYTAKSQYFGVSAPQVVGNQPPALQVGAVARSGILGDPSAYPQVVMNVGGGFWPEGAPAPAVRMVDGQLLSHWAGIAPTCYGPVTTPPVTTTPPQAIVPCESTSTTPPPNTFTTTTTPPGLGCCLRATWECEIIANESTWVLDTASVECVPDADCGDYVTAVCS